MPVRSLNSVVFKWPDRETVLAAARQWAAEVRQRDPTVEQVLCIGSYARGDWGVGSDIDVVVVVSETDLSWPQRYAKYYPDGLPVQADVWVYTRAEWQSLATRSPHLWRRLQAEMLELA
jgi:hypothetical protein